jgi:hypothetical protein
MLAGSVAANPTCKEIIVASCSKCGAGLSPGAQFCAVCGTPLTAAPVPFSPVQPVAAPALAPANSSGSSAVKIILIVVAVFVGLGILGAGAFGFFVWRVAHAIHFSGNGNQVTLNTPQGRISANTTENFSASELGTDVYPGAQPGKGSMRMLLPTGSMISAIYVTSDAKDQVVAFYKSKFPGNVSTYDTVSGSVITYSRTPQESVVVTVTANSSQYGGKTQIHILHTTKAS